MIYAYTGISPDLVCWLYNSLGTYIHGDGRLGDREIDEVCPDFW
jgi:hypothetical protein